MNKYEKNLFNKNPYIQSFKNCDNWFIFVCIFMCVYVCLCVWRPEDKLGCSLVPSLLF